MHLRHFYLLFLCYLGTYTTSGQSIYSALHHGDNEYYDFKQGATVTEVTTKTTFYNNSAVEIKKEVTVFNDQQKITTQLSYDVNGKMTDRLTWMYDSTGLKSIGRKYERWMNALGLIVETAYYEYDVNGYLIKITDKNQTGKIIRVSTITNDAEGYPIELKLLTDTYSDFGKEIAEYDFENNTIKISSFRSDGSIISSHQDKIDYSKHDSDEIYNENGDIIKSNDYTFTYKYDKNLNWIKRTQYRIENGKQIKDAEFARDIKYSKK